MKCSNCNHDMILGHTKIKGSLLGFLVIGLSWMELFFYPSEEPKDRIQLLEPSDRKLSYFCPACKSVLITKNNKY